MKVLVINTLHLKLSGNQAIRNCLLGLANAGHQVIVLQIRGEGVLHNMNELHPNISVEHHSVLPPLLRRMGLKIYQRLRLAETITLRRKRRDPQYSDHESSSSTGQIPVVSESMPRGYAPAAPESIIQIIVDKLHWTIFQMKALYYGSRIIRSERIEVVYGYESWGAPAASLLGRMFDLPIVTRFQGTFLHPMIGNRLKLLTWFDKVIALKNKADLVVMTNDGTKGKEVLSLFGVPDDRILFITNGVIKDNENNDNREKIRRGLGIQNDEPLLLTVSKLALWKRVDRVIQAMPMVLQECSNATLLVVGEGSDKVRLARLAQKLGVEHAVKFMGGVQHEQVYQYYHAADVFISTYDLSNRGNPVLEALVNGACIVTLADGSVDDIVVNGESGILVDVESVSETLPSTILRLLQDPELRCKLSQGARKIARDRLKTWDERNEIEVRRIESVVHDRKRERVS